jgi:hypothetical protein
MNRNQLLNYLIRNGADHFDQRIEWSNAVQFTEESAEFLLKMPFQVSKCARCGEPIYHGDEQGWLLLTGKQPMQGNIHTVDVCSGDTLIHWQLDDYCWRQLVTFAGLE